MGAAPCDCRPVRRRRRERSGGGPRGRGPPGHQHPPDEQGGAVEGVGDQRAAPHARRRTTWSTPPSPPARSRYVQESICFPYLDQGDDWIDEESPARSRRGLRWRGRRGGGHAAVLGRWRRRRRAALRPVPRAGQHPRRDVQRACSAGGSTRSSGAPTPYTSFIHADDAGSAVAAALTVAAGIYNMGDDEPLTRLRRAGWRRQALGVKPPQARSRPPLARGDAELGQADDEVAPGLQPEAQGGQRMATGPPVDPRSWHAALHRLREADLALAAEDVLQELAAGVAGQLVGA